LSQTSDPSGCRKAAGFFLRTIAGKILFAHHRPQELSFHLREFGCSSIQPMRIARVDPLPAAIHRRLTPL
jgi:hypothetical protein